MYIVRHYGNDLYDIVDTLSDATTADNGELVASLMNGGEL